MSFFRKVSFYIKGKREFKRSGFQRNSSHFNPSSLDVDITSRSFVVTGANSGLGKWTALELAKRGASVHMVCRNKERGEAALKEIKEATQNENIVLHQLDISNLPAVVDFVKSFGDSGHKVDVLINNAGIMPSDRQLTDQGFEQTFATNTLGTYLLTKQFMPLLAQSNSPRVIIVSSGGMLLSKLDLTDFQFERMTPFDGIMAYSQTKRQQVVMAHQLADKQSKDTGIRFFSMHPGWTDTPGVQTSMPGFYRSEASTMRTVDQGADTIIWLAVSQDIPSDGNGCFFFDRQIVSEHLTLARTRSTATDKTAFMEHLDKLITPFIE